MQGFGATAAVIILGAIIFAAKVPIEAVQSTECSNYIGTLYDSIKTNAGRDKLCNTAVFFARRALFILALCQSTYVVKFVCLCALSLLQMCYILAVRPHERKSTHYLELFNEYFLLCTIYMLPAFTNMMPRDSEKFAAGWVLTAALIPLFLVNLIHTFFVGIQDSCQEYRLIFKLFRGRQQGKVLEIEETLPEDATKQQAIAAHKKMKEQRLDVVIEELPLSSRSEIVNQKTVVKAKADADFIVKMQTKGLSFTDIAQDGNCMFRAIGYLLFEEEAMHMQVRHDVVNQLLSCSEKYEKSLANAGSYGDYCKNMRSEGIWGDHVEL